jgi:hypothetical protein
MRARRAVKIAAAPAEPAPRSADHIAGDLAEIKGHLEGIEHMLREQGGPAGRDGVRPDGISDAEWETINRESWAWSVLMDALAREGDRIQEIEIDMYGLHRATAPAARRGAA